MGLGGTIIDGGFFTVAIDLRAAELMNPFVTVPPREIVLLNFNVESKSLLRTEVVTLLPCPLWNVLGFFFI